jgi:hypothetical protein
VNTTKALPKPSTDLWAAFARNGRRYHALTKYEPYEYESACGFAVAGIETAMYSTEELQESAAADVPSPPKPCAACVRALSKET